MELKSLTKVYLDMWLHNTIKEYGLTRNDYYNMSTILKQSLEYACMDGVDILQKNPMAGMKVNTKLFVKKPKPKSETQVFLRSEQKLVAEECSFRVNRNPNCTTPISILLNFQLGLRIGDDDDKIRLNQRKPSKYKGLSRFGPEKNLQRINKFMKERPIFYKNLIQMKENFRFYLRCFYCITKVVILQFNSENRTELARNG